MAVLAERGNGGYREEGLKQNKCNPFLSYSLYSMGQRSSSLILFPCMVKPLSFQCAPLHLFPPQ
jgi:hypothetical protein